MAKRRSCAAASFETATTGGMNSRIWPTSSSWLEPAASPDDLEPVGVAADDVEGLGPDRAGRAENHQPSHETQCTPSPG